jgi:hypothetical protein
MQALLASVQSLQQAKQLMQHLLALALDEVQLLHY